MKQGDLDGCSMRGGRWEGVICERSSAGRCSPPLTIGELFGRRAVGVGSHPYSGESRRSTIMAEVHSELVLEIRKLDGRLSFLDSDGLIRSSGSIGVVGGVEKGSGSGDPNPMVVAMTRGWLK